MLKPRYQALHAVSWLSLSQPSGKTQQDNSAYHHYAFVPVRRSYQQNHKVYDCQHTKYPIIGLNISAVFPKGYKFIIYPSMSNELKEISVGPTTRSFKVDGGLLPRQGIVYVLQKVSLRGA